MSRPPHVHLTAPTGIRAARGAAVAAVFGCASFRDDSNPCDSCLARALNCATADASEMAREANASQLSLPAAASALDIWNPQRPREKKLTQNLQRRVLVFVVNFHPVKKGERRRVDVSLLLASVRDERCQASIWAECRIQE